MWGCLQPCSSTIYAIFGNSKSSDSEMVLFGSELVKLLGAGAHYYKWFLVLKYGYLIHLNDCEENQVTMWVFLWPKCWERWILRRSISTYVVWDGNLDRDFLPDEDAILFGADGEGQHHLHQLHVFLKYMTRCLGFTLWRWPENSGPPLLDAPCAKDQATFLLATFFFYPATCAPVLQLYVNYRTAKLCSLPPPPPNCLYMLLSRHRLLKAFLTGKKKTVIGMATKYNYFFCLLMQEENV